MSKSLVLYIFSVFILISCDGKKSKVEGNNLYDLAKIKEKLSSREVIKIIPLETRNDILLTEFLSVKIKDQNIFVFDEGISDAIHLFDYEGNYLKPIVSKGEAPNQLNQINNYDIYLDKIYVVSGQGGQSILNIYNTSGEILKKEKFDFPIFSLAVNESYFYLYGSYNYPIIENRLHIVNRKNNEKKVFLKNQFKEYGLPLTESNFHKLNDGTIIFKESFNSTIYKINDTKLTEYFNFNFGKYAIPESLFSGDFLNEFEQMNEKGFATNYNVFENEFHTVLEVYVQSMDKVENHQIIINKSKNETIKQVRQLDKKDMFYHIIGLTEDNQLIYLTKPEYLKSELKSLNFINKSDFEKAKNLDDDDNPVLVFVQL